MSRVQRERREEDRREEDTGNDESFLKGLVTFPNDETTWREINDQYINFLNTWIRTGNSPSLASWMANLPMAGGGDKTKKKMTRTIKGRKRIIHTGSRGGKYYISNKRKIYI